MFKVVSQERKDEEESTSVNVQGIQQGDHMRARGLSQQAYFNLGVVWCYEKVGYSDLNCDQGSICSSGFVNAGMDPLKVTQTGLIGANLLSRGPLTLAKIIVQLFGAADNGSF